MSLYEKPVRLLMHDMVADMGIQRGDILTRAQVMAWFRERYPRVKDGTIAAHLIILSTNAPSRIHHSVRPEQDDLLFQVNRSRFRLYEDGVDPAPIYEREQIEAEDDEDPGVDPRQASEFAYEADLQRFLAKNLALIEPGLRLYEDEEGVTGIEFPAGGRFIDVLAVDANENLVVIELKVSRGYDRVVGQLLRYMAWIRKHHAEESQAVRGMIVARDISEDLLLACSGVSEVELYEYELSVELRKVNDT